MRFNKYNDLWTKTTLNTVVERITRRNTNNESNLPLTISAQYGLINQNEFFNKQIASRDLTNYILLNRGEFAYNKSYSSDYPWGAVKRLDKYDKGVLSSLYICFAPKSNVNSDFLVHYFETPKWYNEISNIAGEGARNHGLLNMAVSDYFNTKHSFPSIQEQHKISQFLNLINQRIDTQSKIIEDLELFKNMISYKVLYEDKTVCYKPLSSFSELKNGYAFKSNTYSSKGDYQLVTIANVTGNRYIDLTSSNKILNIPNDIQSHQILKINDILISLTGNVGRVSYCNKLNCLLNQRVGLLSIKNKDLIEYIFQCIHNKIFEKTMISRGQGVAQLNIGKYDVESFEIPVYSQDRMNMISEVLKLIDFKIIKEKDILELYKKQKAYLLKNMFI